MAYPQQTTPNKQPIVNLESTRSKRNENDADTIYLDAEIIDDSTRDTANRSHSARGYGTSVSSFAWSSLDGFQRGWNNAYDEKQSADPLVNDTPENGPKTAKSEWKRANITGGLLQTIAGGVVALAGVPMLILPGPGLLAIGLGGALAASGVKKMMGK